MESHNAAAFTSLNHAASFTSLNHATSGSSKTESSIKMYLEEVVLDGFKSYATRTVVGPFHNQFNAISGLNGTGKSNVLDSICFVMGIKSLQQMRVSKLDELIYKQGQAGVTKASVTLVFRNEDRKTSPIGLAEHSKITITRQIVVGGRDRYLMNGHAARPSDIQTIFQSVQLNVNNPHFLVMQGRITKVVNMKPLEVLSMIEEAAGTRIYENKRGESMKKISLKETKLNEITSVIQQEIEPTLQSLRKEQEDYTRALRGAEDVSRLERFCIGYDYWRTLQAINTQKEQHDKAYIQKQELTVSMARDKELILEVKDKMRREEIELKKTDQGQVMALSQEKRSLENALTVCMVTIQESQKSKTQLEMELKKLKSSLDESTNRKAKLIDSSATERQKEDSIKKQVYQLQTNLDDAKATLEELRTGHVSKNSDTTNVNRKTLRQQITALELKKKQLTSEEEQLQIMIAQWESDLRKLEAGNGEGSNPEYAAHQKTIEEKTNRLLNITQQLTNAESLRNQHEEVKKRRAHLEEQIAQAEDKIYELKRKTNLIERFHSENPNGKDYGIEGLALELLRIKEDDLRYVTALEEAGKSRLMNVVTKNDEIAAQLLQKYKKVRRITCIPMNKIKGTSIPIEKIKKAKSIAEIPMDSNDIKRPVDAVDPISPDYLCSILYVFGQVYLCSTSDLAKIISQNPNLKGVAINIKGDQYNPAGCVSGGSSAGLGGLLLAYRELIHLNCNLAKWKDEFDALVKEEGFISNQLKELDQLEREKGAIEILIKSLQTRLLDLYATSSEGQEKKKRQDLLSAKERLNIIKLTELPAIRDIQLPSLKAELESSTEGRDERINKLESRIQTLKAQFKSAENDLALVLEDVTKDLAVLQQQIENTENQIKLKTMQDLSKNEIEMKESLKREKSIKNDLQIVMSKLKKAEEEIQERSGTYHQLVKEKENLELNETESETVMARLNHSIKNLKQSIQDHEKRRKNLLRDYDFLMTVTNELNKVGGDFDFSRKETTGCYDRLEVLKADVERLQKKVNRSVISVLQTAEKQLEGLREKRSLLIKEKQKLEQFIIELDEKKETQVQTCWSQVDQNFSDIFSILLPSSDAHLCLLPNGSLNNGLEMKVTLSGVKKASLGELSGGQRSLLALSLVLALLKYKPAPLYILDEIDAALDLSHTQRIGKMIRTQFGGSQFIVVSLKENLFNYADVLFRTSFAGGSSQIQRTEAKQRNDVDKENRKTSKP